ncbi:MAG: glycogen synthase GlgA [Alphaproteobacteria bacterium]|nr:glycogen synthase GlgA [Alphaproteobacteria bacterium]MBV9862097.1 glycogen synthase GlgA [Alphaproteobacteria bacterium]
MRVLHVAAELFPWVKTGGLADVTAALPPALARLGVETRLLLPGFRAFLDALPLTDVARLQTPFARERVRLGRAALPGGALHLYVVDHPAFYDRPGNPYAGPDGADWPDNPRRFALLGWVAAALAGGADPDWRADILHGHDWHAGLAPAYLAAAPVSPPVATVYTVHNLAYTGFFPASAFAGLALPVGFFGVDGVEFYGGVSFMKAGLFYADRLTTVSPTYAREIQTPAFGVGFEGLLRSRAAVLSGILNGVDPQVWSPENDPELPQRYVLRTAGAGKAAAKAALQRRLGLDETPSAPLFGGVSRLTPQKGLDLLLTVVPDLVAAGGQLALLGSGDRDLEQGFAAAAFSHPASIGVELGYDESLSHLIVAGADAMVVPSRFEPCGLTQLYALRYGALPIVRRVGGLADTVIDATAATLAEGTATGFAFEEESPQGLLRAVERALALYRDRNAWRRVMRRGMTRDFSWDTAARQYLELYRGLRPD